MLILGCVPENDVCRCCCVGTIGANNEFVDVGLEEAHILLLLGAAAVCQLTDAWVAGGWMKTEETGWRGWENCVVDGWRESKRERSGVIVRDGACGLRADIAPIPGEGGPGDWEGLVDHENVGAAGGAGFAGALGAASQPPAATALLAVVLVVYFPVTRRSKSSSSPPFAFDENAAGRSPKDMKSSLPAAFFIPELLPESSWSFFVCSCSTLVLRLLIKSIKAWNCLRSSNGPRLMFHKIGRISIAMNSVSASELTCCRTLRAASITAGSFVLIPRMRGMIFSCIVYLSSALMADFSFFLPFCGANPDRPSSAEEVIESVVPPHKTTKASRPLTLIPRLEVLLNTAATTGNSSFFIVLKSSTGSITGRLRRAASTIEWVGDSIARCIIGRISVIC